MKLLHERWRTRVSLLAAGCLDGAEREATLRHLDSCEACRLERAEALALLEVMAKDPARQAEPPIPVAFLVSRVQARVEAVLTSRRWRWGWVAGAAALGIALSSILPPLVARFVAPRPQEAAMDGATLRRLERAVAREQAVRYLNEAQDVLVGVAATLPRCERRGQHLDVFEETRRSRELLARRALLVDLAGDEVASARPVLEDVEQVLREVAALDPCARPGDLAQIQEEMASRHLLMKIDLMTRELSG